MKFDKCSVLETERLILRSFKVSMSNQRKPDSVIRKYFGRLGFLDVSLGERHVTN
jgi:hypothetical protein